MVYGTNIEMAQYFEDRGYDVPISEDDMSRLRRVASVFVDGLGWRSVGYRSVSRFPGKPTVPGQEREWPRVGATDYYGREIPTNQVPPAVERATYEAAYHEAQNRGALNAVVRTDERVVSEKFGDVSFQYAEPAPAEVAKPIIPAVMAILHPVMSGGSDPYGIFGVATR